MKTAKYLKMKERYQYYERELLKIIEQPIERYNLSSPILCHGYSSVIMIQIYTQMGFELLEGKGGEVLALLGSLSVELNYGRALMAD